jgi:hypothetical protein
VADDVTNNVGRQDTVRVERQLRSVHFHGQEDAGDCNGEILIEKSQSNTKEATYWPKCGPNGHRFRDSS